MRVGVTGLTGMIGKNLVTQQALDEEEKSKTTLVAFARRESDSRFLQEHGIECRRIDYRDHESFAGKLDDIDAFLHLAGLTSAVKPQTYYEVNVGGTATLLEALSRYGGGVKHFLFSSSTSAAGPAPCPEMPKREHDPCNPVSHYGKSKLQAEQLIRSSALNWTIFRLPAVWGPHDYNMLTLFRMIKKGLVTLFADADDAYSYVSAQTVSRFFLRVFLDQRLYGEVFTLCCDEPLSVREFCRLVGAELGLPAEPRYLKVPLWVGYPARAYLDLKQRLLKRASIVNPDKISEMVSFYWLFSNQKIKEALDVPEIENRQALSETIRWFCEQHLL